MPPKIILYYRPLCMWSQQVISFLKENNYSFDGRNISADAKSLEEMVRRTGQESSPCVDIDGHILADVGRQEVEEYMRGTGLLK